MDRRAFLGGLVGTGAVSLLPGEFPVLAADAPGTGPWDIKALQKRSEFTLAEAQRVKEKDTEVLLSEIRYAGEPYGGKPTQVYGFYARPASLPEKRVPAMVLVHGGGGTAFPQWARLWAARGYAALAMDLSGRGPGRERLPDGGPDQDDDTKFRRMKLGLKEQWTYHAVAAVMRGVSVLEAQPEVDRKRIGVTGISWGGYLTSIIMSLDPRLKLGVPVYGCGFLHENSVWVPVLNSLPEDERRAWVENFDPSRYLARCRIPNLWVNGTNDFAYPLDSYQKCYRLVKGPRSLCITVKMPHGHEAGWAPVEIGRFADSIFRPAPLDDSLPVVKGQAVDGGGVLHVGYESNVALLKAQIHWTTELAKPWQQRDWRSAPADVVGLGEVKVELPKERPAVYFVTLTDQHGGTTSTEHAELR